MYYVLPAIQSFQNIRINKHMREVDKIASSFFDKIRSRVDQVSLGDENAKDTQDPEKARFFNFAYKQDGEEIGSVTVSLIDEESMKVYFGTDIADTLKEKGLNHKKWYDFLRSLRMFAKRNLLGFDTRDIARSNLQIKDVKQQSKADSTIDAVDINVTESRLYGTSRHSFMEVGPCKLRIVHSASIDEEKHGARSRKIDQIFIETPHGERFLVSHRSLNGAAALATHIANGGEHNDEIAECINGMVAEMGNMSHFVRSVKRRTDLDDETGEMAHAAVSRYNELKNKLKRLRSPRHYLDFAENYMPEVSAEDEYDVDALRERFVKKIYDDRFDAALPYVYRAHRKQLEAMNNPMAEEFESWADSMLEGTWAVPEEESDIDKLRELMSAPLMVGQNAQDATSALYSIIGDDQLFDDLHNMADIKGPDYDCRPEIVKWLTKHFPSLGQEMGQLVKQSEQPEQPAPGAEPVLGTPQPAEQQAAAPAPEQQPQPAAESADPLDFIRTLAGLRR